MIVSSDVSFIIPCFNGDRWIKTTIHRIIEEISNVNLSYEIIVVDNQSFDDSANIATSAGAQVYSSNAETVAAVRNYGFSKSCGKFIVFLDCDIHLGKGWGVVFSKIVEADNLGQKTVTGSHCLAPDSLKEPLRSWYRGIEDDERNTHLGTGHMIMTSALFKKVGEFDESLTSGEDYEFCQRVLQAGGNIWSNNKLEAWHMGYPETIRNFINRECWHGTSDFSNFNSIINSKVTLAAIFILIIKISIFCFLVVGWYKALALSTSFLIISLTLIVIKKFGYRNIKDLIYKIFIAYFYFLGRLMSIKTLFKRG